MEEQTLASETMTIVTPVQAVVIDIKPGSDTNCFNVDGNGVIPVAILGSDTFDVSQIDTLTLLFAGLETRVRGKKGPLCSIQEVNGDAFPDLVCQFEDDASAWSTGATEAELTGNLLDGTPFQGTDSICIENKNLPPAD